MAEYDVNGLKLKELLIGEIIGEIIGSLNYDPKIKKIEAVLKEKLGPDRLERFKKSLVTTRRRGSDSSGAFNTFVKSLDFVKTERTGSQRINIKLKLTPERKKEIQESQKTNILDDVSIYDYRLAILCEALKISLDSKNGDLNHRGQGGNTVLHFVSALPIDTDNRKKFCVEAINFLVENNVDFRIKNDNSLTALHIITGNHILDFRNDFNPSKQRGLDSKTSINARYEMLNCFSIDRSFDVRGPCGNSILHEWVIQRALCKCEENDEQEQEEARIGRWIIKTAYVSPNKTNDYGCTSLHYAFRANLIKFLCDNGAEKGRQCDSDETPLIYILKYCILRVVVSKVLPPNWDLETKLNGCFDIKENGDMNLQEIVASQSMSLDILEKILKKLVTLGFDFTKKMNEDKDFLDYLLCILRECPFEDCKEEGGVQHCETSKCILDWVIKLIDKDAILCGEKCGLKSPLYQILILYFENPKGLHDEVKNKTVECVRKMLEAGADPKTQDCIGDTALHFCCKTVDPSNKQQKKLVKLICEYGADVHAKNKAEVTPTQILENRQDEKCKKFSRSLVNIKPRLQVEVDLKSTRYKTGLESLCRKKNPQKVGSLRYDPTHIGKGAMSFIFLGIDEKSKREVAVKRIVKAAFEKELENEIKSLVRLEQNAKVVKYYFLDEDPIFHFITLELMEGDLSYLVKEYNSLKVKLDGEVTVKLATDVVEGLTFLHHELVKILHRDLKPGNILFRLDPELCLKLADFGLAKHLTPSDNQSTVLGGSTSSSLTGTRGWMAPELVRREVTTHSESTDMFALGLVLHFLISKGFHPFDQSGAPLFTAIAEGTLKPHELETSICGGIPEHLWKDLSPEAKHVIELLLSENPTQRPSADSLLKYNCYFWSKLKKVEFMNTVGSQEEIAKPSFLFIAVWNLESSPFGDYVRNNPWNVKIPDLFNELNTRRGYDGKSVVHFIRFFRNAYAHFQETSPMCRDQLLNDIFFTTFPDFFLTVFTVVYELGWLNDNSGRDLLLRKMREMK